jgi:hypothetical protein
VARALVGKASADLTVELATGTYRLASTFKLSAADSGTPGHTIVYAAKQGATPILSGAIQVTGFSPVDAQHRVFVASVPPGTKGRQLYVDGRRATRARGPASPPGFVEQADGFSLGDPAIASWPDASQLEVVGTKQWKMFRCPVKQVTGAGLALSDACWAAAHAQPGYTFDSVAWIENALELLDEPGEFYLDEATSKLYYAPRPGEDVATIDVELPTLEELVHAEGTPGAPLHDVAFRGLSFAFGTWLGPSTPDGYASLQATMTTRAGALQKPLANVTMHATHGVRFSSCHFEHLGGAGLAFEVGAQGNSVDHSVFEDISADAVMIGDVNHVEDHHPADPSLIVRDNSVTDSYITRAGAEYWDAVGLFAGYTTHTVFAHNDLFDLPYTAISLGWGWGSVDPGGPGGFMTPSTSMSNEIRSNRIDDHMRALRDGGAIYVLGRQDGSVIDGNVVTNQAGPFGNLYLDNGTQGYSVTNNVVLVSPKADWPAPDPDRSYWLYVQVYNPVALNNSAQSNFTNDPTLLTPQPIDPSNSVSPPTVLGQDLSPAAAVLAAAGSPLRSPEIGIGKPATATSVFDAGHGAEQANNGSSFDGWSPSGSDMSPSWQVDLGQLYAIDAIEVVTRWALDQPTTRRSFRVVASADAMFTKPIVIGSVDAAGLPHRAIFSVDVRPSVKARYVRVEKTVPEYFFLGEVRIHGQP